MGQKRDIIETAANVTLAYRDTPVTVICTAADLVITLPKAQHESRGMDVMVQTFSLSVGTGTSISPDADDKIQGTGITAADDKDLINSGASDAIGDTAQLVCDGVDGWRIVNLIGTWARQA